MHFNAKATAPFGDLPRDVQSILRFGMLRLRCTACADLMTPDPTKHVNTITHDGCMKSRFISKESPGLTHVYDIIQGGVGRDGREEWRGVERVKCGVYVESRVCVCFLLSHM